MLYVRLQVAKILRRVQFYRTMRDLWLTLQYQYGRFSDKKMHGFNFWGSFP